jgi:anaphase-promoting complex subunit 3
MEKFEEIIIKEIENSNKNQIYNNSIFLGERLYAQNKSAKNLLILGRVYYQSGSTETAYHFLNNNSESWKTKSKIIKESEVYEIYYLLSLACLKLEKYDEAEILLESLLKYNYYEPSINYWLGIIYRYTNRIEKSITHFLTSLKSNDMMWSSFENLCQLGIYKN